MPTNHTKGVYSLNDPGFNLGIPDPQKVYYPDVDGNWPPGIPGTPGELEYVRPAGYWSGGSDWDSQVSTDFSQDYLNNDPTGRSTSGLISDNGTVFSELPPNSEAFILGPVVDGFVPNHTSDAYTNIGYIQKDTRQFVLLARVQGQWKSGLNGNQYPVWGGTSTGFTSYNQNFTLEMAQWVRDKILNDKYVSKVPYFYSGGVPQVPQSPADCPNCPPGMYGGNGIGPRQFGSGGNPSIGTKQGDPKSGDAKDAGFPWELFKKGKESISSFANQAFLAGTKIIKGIATNLTYTGQYMFKGLPPTVTKYIPTYTGGGIFGLPKMADWAGPLGTKIVKAIVGDNYYIQYFTPSLNVAKSKSYAGPQGTIVVAQRPAINAPSIKNPAGMPVSTSIYGEPEIQASSLRGGTPAIETIRLSDPDAAERLSKYAAPVNATAQNLARSLAVVGGAAALADANKRLERNDITGAGLAAISAIPGTTGLYANGATMLYDYYNLIQKGVERTKASPERTKDIDVYKQMMPKYSTSSIQSAQKAAGVREEVIKEDKTNIIKILENNNLPTDFYEYMKMLVSYMIVEGFNIHFANFIGRLIGDKITEDEEKYLKNDFLNLIKGMNYIVGNEIKESTLISENRQRILREIKKPYQLPEIPKQKYKMNFSGKYSAQNTPDKTASKLSDDLVASGNARGQKWRTQDKYWQGYETTERMNVIYDRVGHGDQYFERIVDENQKKVSWKNKEIQEHLNILAHEKAMKQENPNYDSPFYKKLDEQETIDAPKDPLFKKVSKKLKPEIDYPDKPSKNGVPNEPPPEMVNGFHPDYGKKSAYYKKLDPHSAESMPPTGDPEIDSEVQKAKKVKMKETKKYNWRTSLQEQKNEYFKSGKIEEQMTTADVFYTTLSATGDVDLANPAWNILGGQGYSVSGGTLTIGDGQVNDGAVASFDSSFYSNLVFDASISGSSIFGVFPSVGDPLLISDSSGTYSVNVTQSSDLTLLFLASGVSGSVSISNLRFQRRTPISVFVPLDNPEASSFVRTGSGDLSPEEKQKRLKEMLESSDEYVQQMYGDEFPGSGAVPPGESGDIPGVDIQDFQIASEPLRGQKTDVKYDPNMKMFVPRPSEKDAGELIQTLVRNA